MSLDYYITRKHELRAICRDQIEKLPRAGRVSLYTVRRTPAYVALVRGATMRAIDHYNMVLRELMRGPYLKANLLIEQGFLDIVAGLPRHEYANALLFGEQVINWFELSRDAAEHEARLFLAERPSGHGFDRQTIIRITHACHETIFCSLPARHAVLYGSAGETLMRRHINDPEVTDALVEIQQGRLPGHRCVDSMGAIIGPSV